MPKREARPKAKKGNTEEQDRIRQRIREAEAHRSANYENMWRDCYRRYRSRPATVREGSNIFVPETFMIVDVIVNRTAESLFNTRPYVSVLPRDEGHSDNARKVQELLDWQLADVINADRLFSEELIPTWAVYGTVIAYDAWKIVRRKVKKPTTRQQPVLGENGLPLIDTDTNLPVTEEIYTDENGQRLVEEREEKVYDDPTIQSIDLFDFFVDPQAANLEEARYCGHLEYRTRGELQDFVENAGWKIDWEQVFPVPAKRGGAAVRQEDQGLSSGGDSGDAQAEKNKQGLYEVRHYWEPARHVAFVGDYCALDEGNPYWHGRLPYKRACYVSLPGEFYGVGLPEMLAALQDELNTVRNQRIDYNSMALRRMWKLRKGCGLTAKDLIWRQNGVIQVENIDDVMEINVQDIPASAFANEEAIKQDMKDATGCHDILMGLSPADETATTTMTKDNNASIRFRMGCTKLAEDILVPVSQDIIAMDQQFMTEDKRVVLDKNAPLSEGGSDLISPLDVDGDFDLIYVGSSIDPLANKEMTKEKLIQAIQLALQMPAYANAPDALLGLFKRLLQAMDIKAPEELIPELPPPMPAGMPGAGLPGGGSPGPGAPQGIPPELMQAQVLSHAPQIGMSTFDELGADVG